MSTNEQILRRIEAYCRDHKISETAFGRASVKDGHLVRRLRGGKSVTTKRLDQIEAFLAAQVDESALREAS